MPKAKTWEEYKLECEAVAKPGITILGWVGDWKGCYTKLHCHCDKHGEWFSTIIHSFKRGRGCPGCQTDALIKRNLKSDEEHIQQFMATGKFREGTFFKRCKERRAVQGDMACWSYTCPICSTDQYVLAGLCNGVFSSQENNLKRGILPCRCSPIYRYTKAQWEYRYSQILEERGYIFRGWVGTAWGRKARLKYECPVHGNQVTTGNTLLQGCGCPLCAGYNQQQCYINLVSDQNIPLACKIGIAKDSEARLKSQNQRNLFQMQQLAVYEFPTVEDCKAAERACLSELRCGVISQRELQDGYTETVTLTDYDKVVSIYERFGGVRVDTLTKEAV